MTVQLLLLLAFVAASQSQTLIGDTTNITMNGYPFRKDAHTYLNLSIATRDILGLIKANPPNWIQAKKIYAKRQIFGKPIRTMQILAQSRNGNWSGQPLFELYKAYYKKKTQYIEDYIGAFDDTIKVEVGLYWCVFGLMMDHTDAPKAFMLTNISNNIRKARGEMDDIAGMYMGYANTPSLWNLNDAVAAKWGRCSKSINQRVVPLLKDMRIQVDSTVGKGEAAWAGYAALYKQYWTLQITAWLRAVQYRVAQKNLKSQAYAYGYLLIVLPQLKDQTSAKKLQSLLASKTKLVSVATAKNLVTTIAKKQNIPIDDVIC